MCGDKYVMEIIRVLVAVMNCIALTSQVGSISENQLGGWYSYRACKSAVNQLVHSAAIEAKRFEISKCFIVSNFFFSRSHKGWKYLRISKFPFFILKVAQRLAPAGSAPGHRRVLVVRAVHGRGGQEEEAAAHHGAV